MNPNNKFAIRELLNPVAARVRSAKISDYKRLRMFKKNLKKGLFICQLSELYRLVRPVIWSAKCAFNGFILRDFVSVSKGCSN